MIIARWHIDARFGHEQRVIDSLKSWSRDIASTGSVGALESTIELEVRLEDWPSSTHHE